MHPIDPHVQTLTAHATATTTLLAVGLDCIRRYPEGTAVDLARPDQVALRLVERAVRLALNMPPRDAYHVLQPPECPWAILLAPRHAPVRFYLSRADKRRFYRPTATTDTTTDTTMDPATGPAVVIAEWKDARHVFGQVATTDQVAVVLFASTADRNRYIPPEAPATATSTVYTSTSTT